MVSNQIWYLNKVGKIERQITALIEKRNFYAIKAEEMRLDGLRYRKTYVKTFIPIFCSECKLQKFPYSKNVTICKECQRKKYYQKKV